MAPSATQANNVQNTVKVGVARILYDLSPE
jgi:hypothetical protein